MWTRLYFIHCYFYYKSYIQPFREKSILFRHKISESPSSAFACDRSSLYKSFWLTLSLAFNTSLQSCYFLWCKMHSEDALDFPQRNTGCLQLQKEIECCLLTRLLQVSITICHSLYWVAGTFIAMRSNQTISYIYIHSFHTELSACSKSVGSCFYLFHGSDWILPQTFSLPNHWHALPQFP